MKFVVYSCALDRKTRKQIPVLDKPGGSMAWIRSEVIDTMRNALFRDCSMPITIEMAYEAFWNELNPNSENIVKVVGVEEVQERVHLPRRGLARG